MLVLFFRSLSLFSHLNHLAAQGSDQLFSSESAVSITNEENITCRNTGLDGTAHDQSIFSKQLRTGKFRGELSMKDK